MSENVTESGAEARGQMAGVVWAAGADRRLLDRLGKLYEQSGAGWDCLFDPAPDDTHSAGEKFYFALHPQNIGDRPAAAAFWEQAGVAAGDALHPAFVYGFAEAAVLCRAAEGVDPFFADAPGFLKRLRAKANLNVLRGGCGAGYSCWACSAVAELIGFNVQKDMKTLGLPAHGYEPRVTLCVGCAGPYMRSFNEARGLMRR